jgi:hypothetical protein
MPIPKLGEMNLLNLLGHDLGGALSDLGWIRSGLEGEREGRKFRAPFFKGIRAGNESSRIKPV